MSVCLLANAFALGAEGQITPANADQPPPRVQTETPDAPEAVAATLDAGLPIPVSDPAYPSERADRAAPILLGPWLVTSKTGRYGRSPIHVDSIQVALARGDWAFPDGTNEADATRPGWTLASVDADGWLRDDALRGGYAATRLTWPKDEIVLLNASGHSMVYVNGVPFAGDPYMTGRVVLPIPLRKGDNELLFHTSDGRLRAEASPPAQPVTIDLRDAQYPDLVRGESGPRFASVLVVNARDTPLVGAQVTALRAGGQTITASVGPIAPVSLRRIVIPVEGVLSSEELQAEAVRVQLDLAAPDAAQELQTIHSSAFDLAVVDRDELQNRSFLSRIDGTVQSYQLLPAKRAGPSDAATESAAARRDRPGLLIALHDAGVAPDRIMAGQSPLEWAHVIAPLGRRPEACDWEDFGRIDAFEAIDDAMGRIDVDRRRVWLSGQGAGGHGAWRLAALHPFRFAAVATLGGWTDYGSYGGSLPRWESPNGVEQLLDRCAQSTALLPMVENLSLMGVSIQHWVDDPAVPLDEATRMRGALATFHSDFSYRELFDEKDFAVESESFLGSAASQFMRNRTQVSAADADHVSYAAFSLDQGHSNRWLTILEQQSQKKLCRAELVCMGYERRYLGVTSNVAALAIDVSALTPSEPVTAILDGQLLGPVAWPDDVNKQIVFERHDDRWQVAEDWTPHRKSPQRPGGFRTAFNRPVTLVYGTIGTPEENAWSMAKARFDAQTFWVRAGGAADVVADVDFRHDVQRDRNVVVYGNADTNLAWPQLLSTSPVQVRRGQIRVGRRPESGDGLACLLVQPRFGSDTAVVGAVSGAGLAGMRATDRIPYFVAGVVLPDLLVFDARALETGTDEIRAAGFFGNDWSLEGSEIAWRDAAL